MNAFDELIEKLGELIAEAKKEKSRP